MLQNIRMGSIDDSDLDVLLEERETQNGTCLFSLKDDVKDYNDNKLETIPGDPEKYGCADYPNSFGDNNDKQRYHQELSMKVGMPVVLLANASAFLKLLRRPCENTR